MKQEPDSSIVEKILKVISLDEGQALLAHYHPWYFHKVLSKVFVLVDRPEHATVVTSGDLELTNSIGMEFDLKHIARHSPDLVLRRCAASRRILAEHFYTESGEDHPKTVCATCGSDSRAVSWPCPTLIALACMYGLSVQI